LFRQRFINKIRMSFEIEKIKIDKKIAFFRFKKLGNFYLLTNEFFFIKLSEEDFLKFIEGKLDQEGVVFNSLKRRGFIKGSNFNQEIINYQLKNNFLLKRGVGLHIVVVTKRCNYLCVYCQAGSPELQDPIYDMTEETAKKTVDFIFQSPKECVTIEFQGGEPLINFKIIKFIIEYANEKNKTFKKDLRFALITNLSLMTEEIYKYLIEKKVNICTSLDGPEKIHNENRPFKRKKGSYRIAYEWIKKAEGLKNKIAALPTLTKKSLENIEGIVDEYIKNKLNSIHFRSLSYLGNSGEDKNKSQIGYSCEEFICAWKRGMDYVIQKNFEGIDIRERGTLIILDKIFKKLGSTFLDLRSPCGAGIGQLAYFYDGRIYSCDEGRMVEEDVFLLGDVNNTYDQITQGEKVKTLVIASTLENFACDECVYKPYCGICPVSNYILYKNLFPNIKETDNCKIHTAMLDYIFLKMEDKEVLEIFKKWIT